MLFKEMSPSWEGKFVVVVVGASKRHHFRFFPNQTDRNAVHRNGNPLPGTLVENYVTAPFDEGLEGDADPFLDLPTGSFSRRDYTLSSNEDIVMLSRSASGRIRVLSDMSGISFEQRASVVDETDVSAVDYETTALVVERPTMQTQDAPFARGQETFEGFLLRVSPVHAPPMGI
jgi:hypothetical protein